MAGHVWQLDEDGEVDTSAYDIDIEGVGHSGPKCAVCGFFFCEFCHREWWGSECIGEPVPLLWRPARSSCAGS